MRGREGGCNRIALLGPLCGVAAFQDAWLDGRPQLDRLRLCFCFVVSNWCVRAPRLLCVVAFFRSFARACIWLCMSYRPKFVQNHAAVPLL